MSKILQKRSILSVLLVAILACIVSLTVFIGNLTAAADASSAVEADGENTTQIQWQIKGDGDWEDYDASKHKDGFFIYDGTDQSDKIRAVVNKDDTAENAYAKSAEVSDGQKSSDLYLELSVNSSEVQNFLNAGTYTFTVVSESGEDLKGDSLTLADVELRPQIIELGENDYAEFADGDNKLWQLQIGTDSAKLIDLLGEGTVFIDPENGSENVYGEFIRTGDREYAYARYRGEELSLVLNRDYELESGKTLSEIFENAVSTTCTHNGAESGLTGENGRVTEVTTLYTVTFDSNYAVIEGSEEEPIFSNTIVITKTWYIVTIPNNLRTSAGPLASVTYGEWTFGVNRDIAGYAHRAEHGNTVIYTYYTKTYVEKEGTEEKEESLEQIRQFAAVYTGDIGSSSPRFYEVTFEAGKIVPDYDNPIDDAAYLYTYHGSLKAGEYVMAVTVPENEPIIEKHRHWWESSSEEYDDVGVRYYAYTFMLSIKVKVYEIQTDSAGANVDANLTVKFPDDNYVEYSGTNNNFVFPVIKLYGTELEYGVDYELYSEDVNVGEASLTVIGKNSLKGQFTVTNAYIIVKARNSWKNVPTIMNWTYGGYDKNVNLISATPALLDAPNDLWFKISYDNKGRDIVKGLGFITLDATTKLVSDTVAAALKNLPAGDYFLIGQVREAYRGNYDALEPQAIPFRVFTATNSWKITPSVNAWTEGKIGEVKDPIRVAAAFGTVHVLIEGADGKTYYDSDLGIDILSSAKAGRYTLTAWVDADENLNFYGLDRYMINFQVFEKPGLPWWATLLIALGALAIAALIIFILWKKGVFQIMSEKIVVAIRTKANMDATLAAIRAAKMMEEGKQSGADAKRRERLERLRQKAKEQRALSPEERAAQLEAKAKADEERAEKLRARSEAVRAKAAKMRDSETAKRDTLETTEAPETPETPTEE